MITTYKDVSRQTWFLGAKPLDAGVCLLIGIFLLRFFGSSLTGLVFSCVLFGICFRTARKYSKRTCSYTEIAVYMTTPSRLSLEKEYADQNKGTPLPQ